MVSERCACGVKLKAHPRKSKRGQLPGLATDRRGVPVKSKTKRRLKYKEEKAGV